MTADRQVVVVNTGAQGPVRWLEERPHLEPTIVTEERFLSLYSEGARVAVVDSVNSLDAVQWAAVNAAPPGGYHAAVGLSERSVLPAAFLRSYFGLPGISLETALLCTNKFAMKRRLQAAGLSVAPHALACRAEHLEAAAETVGWPVIVKPVYGSGVDQTFVVRDRDELHSPTLEAEWERLTRPETTSAKGFPVIVEELLDVEHEFHCDAVIANGEVALVVVSRYVRQLLYYGGSVIGSYTLERGSEDASTIEELNRRTIAALGISSGVTHLEVLRTPQGDRIGEIACRPGGAGIPQMLRYSHGVDIWENYLRISVGEPLQVDVSRTPGVVLQCMLPMRRGEITDITPEEELLDVPGALAVEYEVSPGDIVDGIIDSCANAGYVYIWAGTEDDVPRLVAEVDNRFELRTR
jgi:biotin carboxylase